jgi:hypothetical protein
MKINERNENNEDNEDNEGNGRVVGEVNKFL